ncbi:MAG TPA: alkaline phosphatase family protein [Anaerolineales bacterium]|nr:alkaline phosphatase family protein [Anaerolineales bacterium]
MQPTRHVILMTLLFTIVACQFLVLPSLVTPTSPPPPMEVATGTARPTETLTGTATDTPPPTLTLTPVPQIRRVLILSIDGLRPDLISLAPMPNLMNFMQTGAYSLTAQTVRPSVTLVSHASMLTGYCPADHGVNWNDYIPENGYALGTDLFDIVHAAGLETWMFVGKRKLEQVTEPSSLTGFTFVNDRDLVVAERLISEFPENFSVLFVHFAMPDAMGHQYGWLSPEQLSVSFRADEAFANLLAALDARNLRSETLIIVTADHGGHETSHGSSLPEDMTIPWIASGPGIRPGPLSTAVHTMDTAATAAFALGLEAPSDWDGVPVFEAFGLPVEEISSQCE